MCFSGLLWLVTELSYKLAREVMIGGTGNCYFI